MGWIVEHTPKEESHEVKFKQLSKITVVLLLTINYKNFYV